MVRERTWPAGAGPVLVAVFAVALAVRAAWAPVAGISTGDAWVRTWLARLWLEDPEWIDAGIWPPLHFYLLGGTLALVPDMLTAGRLLHVVTGSLAAVAAAAFAGELARSRFAALWGGLFVALAPLFVAVSLEARPEAPTLALLFLAAFALARRRNGGGWGNVLLAGLAAAGTTMLRYEMWLVVPVLALVLWRDRGALVLFLALALAFPLLWLWGNWRVFGDPLYFSRAAASWPLELEGRARLPLEARIADTLRLLQGAARSLSLPLALAAIPAVLAALLRPGERFLAAAVPVVSTFHLGLSLEGALHPKPQYALLWTVPALPFVAVGLARLRSRRAAAVAAGLLAVLAPLLALPGSLGAKDLLWRLGALPMVPRMEEKARLDRLAARLRQARERGEGLALDLFDLGPPLVPRAYLCLALSPRPGDFVELGLADRPEIDARMRMAHFDRPRGGVDLPTFLTRHPEGVLVVREGSNFAVRHGLPGGSRRLSLAGRCLGLDPRSTVEIPPRLGRLHLYHYRPCTPGPAAP